MSKVKKIQIKCLNCEQWFDSPISFGDLDSFDTSTLEGNQVQCPHCSKMTGCNKKNIRVSAEGAGFVGTDT